MYRKALQQQADSGRRTYTATFPRDVAHDAVLDFVRALSGPLRPATLQPASTVVFEVYGDVRGLRFFVSIPRLVTEGIEGLLTTHIPGLVAEAVLEPDDPITATKWDRVVEFGTSTAHAPLRIGSPAAVVAGLLSCFANLKDGDALAQQWVITGARPLGKLNEGKTTWPRKAIDAEQHKKKHSDATFLAVGRLAAKGEAPDNLMRRLTSRFHERTCPDLDQINGECF